MKVERGGVDEGEESVQGSSLSSRIGATMAWWGRLWHRDKAVVPDRRLSGAGVPEGIIGRLRLTLPGWKGEAPIEGFRVFHDGKGNVLTLGASNDLSVHGLEEQHMRSVCRKMAQANRSGLIEARQVATRFGAAVSLIYKRLEAPAYIFTGMFILSIEGTSCIWTAVAGESGTTGLREAVVTAEMLSAGTLTPTNFEKAWVSDPYDSTYSGVDRSVLRCLSDDESYDARFPWHPLSRVRRILAALPEHVELVAASEKMPV